VLPAVIAIVLMLLRLLYCVLCYLLPIVYFFILLPIMCFFVAIAGPILWVGSAYKYSPQSKSNITFFVPISLPWTTFGVSLLVYNLATINVVKDDFNVTAVYIALAAAYVFFYTNAFYLRKYHQRPDPQTNSRSLYGGSNSVLMNRQT